MDIKVDLGHARVVTMRELNQRTSAVIDELNDTGEPVVVTKHGKFVALLQPLSGHRIESMVLSNDSQFQAELRKQDAREERGDEGSKSLDAALAWIED